MTLLYKIAYDPSQSPKDNKGACYTAIHDYGIYICRDMFMYCAIQASMSTFLQLFYAWVMFMLTLSL